MAKSIPLSCGGRGSDLPSEEQITLCPGGLPASRRPSPGIPPETSIPLRLSVTITTTANRGVTTSRRCRFGLDEHRSPASTAELAVAATLR